jgi:4-hydroxy-tetrahydrodipicolinate synthase
MDDLVGKITSDLLFGEAACMDFGRVVTALITPFQEDGSIDYDRLSHLLHHLAEHGTDTFLIAGTTGESPSLTHQEKLDLFRFAVQEVGNRAGIIAGTGSNNTAASVELTKEAEAIGVDGIMLVAPYYNKPSQEGLYRHFKTIAEATPLPVMLYNIPGRASVNISAKTIIRLAEIPNITSVKEASGDLTQMAEIIQQTREDFLLYSGDDKLTLPVMAIGGYGVVSVASHLIGVEIRRMIDDYLNGHVAKAALLHRKLLPLFEGLFLTSSPSPLKVLLEKEGLAGRTLRLPICEPSPEDEAAILNIYESVKKNLDE